MSRWIRMQTAIFEHELFQAEPLTEREAWLWLIAHAAWKDTKHRVGMDVHDVQTGSLFVTLRQLQNVWRWKSDYRVRAFLKVLEKHEMIVSKSNAGKTHVTICNYSHYQEAERNDNAEKTQTKRTKDTNTPINTSSLRSEVSIDSEFETDFWPTYPRKIGKGQALKAFRAARKHVALEAILAGLSRYVESRRGENPEFTKHASTWLNGQCWTDEPETKRVSKQSSPQQSEFDDPRLMWMRLGQTLEQQHVPEPDSDNGALLAGSQHARNSSGNDPHLRLAYARTS